MQWFGTYHWTYNQCVAAWREKEDASMAALHEQFVNANSILSRVSVGV